MTAAYLLLTACLAGADPAPVAPAPAPAPAPVAASGCSSCSSCSSCCDDCCGGPSILDRLKECLRRKNSCCDSCCTSSCDSCCEEKPGLLDRLKARFHHNDCCSSCCDSCGSSCCGGGAAPGPKAEPIGAPKDAAPKKMPDGAEPGKTSLEPAPVAEPAANPF